MPEQPAADHILGIDLGSNSLGWAMIGLEEAKPAKVLRAGVRVFEAATEGDRESGQEESRNKARREARLHRRQLWRRGRRLRKIFKLLQTYGLLPPGNGADPEERQKLLNELDKQIVASPWFAAKKASGLYPESEQTMPYILRAAALDERLEPHFLGRPLYHLAQRRGFLSNRLRPAKKGDDVGEVKKGISELRKAMEEAKARSLGEYFSRLAPSETRIRGRWTHRDMYRAEFNQVWEAQAKHHPGLLTDERRKELSSAIFYQRPLRFDPDVIGMCQLEPGERRAPAHLLISQRFRLLQTVNNLHILPPGGTEMELNPEGRQKLIDRLEQEGDLTFAKARKLFGWSKAYAFNLESGGEKSIKGNRTFADFYAVFGPRWLGMSAQERDQVVEYVHAFEKPDKLKGAARKRWALDDTAAENLADISLEPDHMNLSRRAMEKVLPLLEQGLTYAKARQELYPEKSEAKEPEPYLPPAEKALLEIRNPAVLRSLTELRKVVNAIVRQYGKPVEVHIELARDLKKPKKARKNISDDIAENRKARVQAAKKIIAEVDISEPSGRDILKAQLWQECGGHCPYTGKPIAFRDLFSGEPQFDIEHIIPRHLSFDNTFRNVTLCEVHENREKKAGRTPFQAYSGNPGEYRDVLDRVRKFQGKGARGKLRRFLMNDEELEEFLNKFTERQLRDTAYASRTAANYLGVLYGGVNDQAGNQRIVSTSGEATFELRKAWQLNSVLGDGPTSKGGTVEKKRTDHRHHAVDAVAIALTSQSAMKQLSDAARRGRERGSRALSMEGPWPDFVDTVREAIDRIVVSHRVSKKVSGALHEETLYSAKGDAEGERRVRKLLSQLTKSEAGDIADEEVKRRVLEKLADGDPKRVFSNPENTPFFETEEGRRIPIKRVRIKKAVPTFALGDGKTARHVTSESNHHLEVFAELDENGNEVEWDGVVVPMAEAYRRKKLRLAVVQRDHGPQRRFRFSLGQGEVVECDDKQGDRSLFVFRKVTQFSVGGIQIGFAPLNDARKAREMQVSRAWLWTTPNTLGERHARKVVVSPLGEVSEAHD
jgi:CRISPR-associated endonuclease Csn1